MNSEPILASLLYTDLYVVIFRFFIFWLPPVPTAMFTAITYHLRQGLIAIVHLFNQKLNSTKIYLIQRERHKK